MADRKITELANITGANLADADEFVVVDASADETKAITFAELKSGLDTATGFVRITGDTMTGDLNGTNVTLSGYLRGPSSFTIDPAAHGDNTGTVVVAGNLQVDGTTTTINSTTLDVDDLNITVASGAANAAAANGAGLTVDGASATFTYASTGDKWTMNKPLDVTGNIIVSGTVDGRDVASDGTKLDTIATSATANPNAIDNVVEDTTPQLGGDLASNGNDILFADNDKAIFGAGSDLQIFHTGLYSFISDQGTGGLYIDTNGSEIALRSNTGSENMLLCQQDGAVTLYYDNASKLATTSSGIDVTGTAVTDGVTVAGNLSVDGGTIKLDGNYPTGTGNVALGDAAMNGSISGNYNTAIGDYSMQPITSGASNTGVGGSALRFVTSGSYNTAVGHQSLHSNTTASNNTAVGYQAGYANTTGAGITAVGYRALDANTTGNNNVAMGTDALGANSTGIQNTAMGAYSGQNVTTANYNTLIGYTAGQAQTTAADNTFVGNAAGYSTTTGGSNHAFGSVALYLNTTGTSNVAMGYAALIGNTTGSNNVGIGHQALYSNTTASNNTAVGYQAGYANTTGGNVTAVGRWALKANTTGNDNTAVGLNALLNNTTGALNTALGQEALASNTTGEKNTALGHSAGYSNTTGYGNVFVGNGSGNSTTGNGNTFIGGSTAGSYFPSGYYVTTGSNNTIIGGYNGNQGGLDIRTSSNNIVLSDGDGNPRMWLDNSGTPFIPRSYSLTTSNAANLFIESTGAFYRSTSSIKYKRDVQNATHGLAEILALRPVTYKGKNTNDGDTVFGGLIAEEVHDAGLTEFVQYNDEGQPDALAYGNMVSLCIKAIQEQQATITALEARITALENA